MAEDAPTGTTDAPQTTDKPAGESGKTFTQEQVNDLLAKQKGDVQRKYADYDDVKSKASKLDEIEQANASELEKAQSKATATEKERDEAKREALRLRVAVEQKLPAELIDRLKGDSKEDLEADATELLKLVKPAEATDFDGGARTPAPERKSPEEAHNDFLKDLLAGKQPT